MLEVTGLTVQSAGAVSEKGPIARLPSGCFSSDLGAVFSGTDPCALSAGMPACGFGGAVAPACGLAALPDWPEPQSLAGGRSPLGGAFLHETTNATAITRAWRSMPPL